MIDPTDLPEPFRRPIPTLEVGRVVLRAFEVSDAETLEEAIDDADVAAGTLTIPHPYPRGSGRPWIEQHDERWRAGKSGTWAITERGSELGGESGGRQSDGGRGRRVLGAVSLRFTLAHRRAEVGYWVARDAWGRGLATDAVRAVIAFAFGELHLHRVDAHHFVENPASGRVMQKAGMRSEGRRRGAVIRAGVPRDVEEYAILETDPRP